MFTMAGTIKNSVRMAALDQKWQQKKNSFGQDKKKLAEMTAEERQLQDFREQAEQMRKSQKHANIDAKLAAGEELTPEEIEYLRQNNPQALKDYEDTQKERESYKRALRNCRTKEEVERLKYTKMGQFMAEAKKISSNACIPTEEEAREAEKAEKEQREAENTGADETEDVGEAEDAEDVKDSDAELPKDTRRKKKAQPAGSLPEGSAAIHSILTSVVAAADGIPGEINVKI